MLEDLTHIKQMPVRKAELTAWPLKACHHCHESSPARWEISVECSGCSPEPRSSAADGAGPRCCPSVPPVHTRKGNRSCCFVVFSHYYFRFSSLAPGAEFTNKTGVEQGPRIRDQPPRLIMGCDQSRLESYRRCCASLTQRPCDETCI